MHSGNVGHAQDLDTLVRATTFLRDLDDLLTVIIGFGARHADIVALATRLEADARALPALPAARACCRSRSRPRTSTSSGSAAGSPATSSRAGSTGSSPPGGPVIVARRRRQRDGARRREVGCGIVVPPGRPDLLARAIRERCDDGELRPRGDGRRGREYVEPEADRDGRDRALPERSREVPVGDRGRGRLFWVSLGALAWTHVGYPASRRSPARAVPPHRRGRSDATPSVTVIVAAHNEEAVIERRLENLLALDYPRENARDRRHLRRVDRPHRGARRRRPARA